MARNGAVTLLKSPLFAGGLFLLFAGFVAGAFVTRFSTWKERDRFVWYRKIRWVEEGALRDREILFLGDSQTMSGIYTPVMEKGLGLRAFNLGMPSQQPEGLESLLPLVKRSGFRGKFLIVNVGPYAFYETGVYQPFLNYYRGELLNLSPAPLLRGRMDLAGATPGAFASQWLRSLSLLSLHDELHPHLSMEILPGNLPLSAVLHSPDLVDRSRILHFLDGPLSLFSKIRGRERENRAIESSMEQSDGFWTWNREGEPVVVGCSAISPRAPGLPASPHFRIRKGAIPSLRRFLADAKRSGYRVILVEVPLSPAWWRIAGGGGLKEESDRVIDDLVRTGGVELLRPPPDLFAGTSDNFQDFTHLSPCGAKRYSEWLVTPLKALLSDSVSHFSESRFPFLDSKGRLHRLPGTRGPGFEKKKSLQRHSAWIDLKKKSLPM